MIRTGFVHLEAKNRMKVSVAATTNAKRRKPDTGADNGGGFPEQADRHSEHNGTE